ncbi:F-box domain, Leucine-rich repeat domain, L domain-like protein [Artemisia annua]|uniref:F-box domain, Leucine-rich repeat domain, L domain-like protein n=1 Tax=Artemisia annua TaxID=35608 RepID=A0A2U1LPA8_ARTAN|nr:F-box domain, Leucine-rich repeat domain, L domain-like protein [Artemisia annua]
MASNGIDFISNMPDPILLLILQGLPNTEEVVRTSVLSTRWRYLWTSIPYFPSLNLDCDRLLKPYFKLHEKFKDFVTWCLANKAVGLDSFRLCCSDYYSESTVNVWIKAAVNRNVKSLDLSFYPKKFMNYVLPVGFVAVTRIHLPQCLITCESLESLRLFAYQNIISLPSCSGFLGLKVLELNNVYCYDHDLVAKFLKMCVVLEELSLIECVIRARGRICISSSRLKTLRIHCNSKNVINGKKVGFRYGLKVCCPELVIFEYVGSKCQLILEDLNSLNKAVIHPKDTLQQTISPTSGKAASKLLAGISHVDSLSLNVYIIHVQTYFL